MKECLHCKNPVDSHSFCCKGCEIAYKVLHQLNLQQYYKNCREIFGATPKTVNILAYSNYAEHIDDDGAFKSIILHIPEIVCGACVWLLEHSLRNNSKCQSAHINFASRNLTLKWAPEIVDLDQMIKLINSLGYNALPISEHQSFASAQKQEHIYLKKIGIAALGTFFTMMLAICVWFSSNDGNMLPITRNLFYLISLLIAVPCICYSADIFAKKAWQGLRQGYMDFNCSITLAIITATSLSIYNTFTLANHIYFDSALALVCTLLLGKYLELKVRNHSLSQCSKQQRLEQNHYILQDGSIKSPTSMLPGDQFTIKPGQTVPVDSVLISSNCLLDNSIITGESLAQKLYQGQHLTSGSVNLKGAIKVRAIKKYTDSYYFKANQQINEVNCQTLSADIAAKIAKWFTPVVLFVVMLAIYNAYYIQGQNFADALYIASTLLIITCPCAIGIAIPLAAFVVSSHLGDKNIYVKNAAALEKFSRCGNIIFDKTGTLTTPKLYANLPGSLNESARGVLKTLACLSMHPKSIMLAEALSEYDSVEYTDFSEGALGTKFIHNGVLCKLGSSDFVGALNINDTIFFAIGDIVYPIKYQELLRENAEQSLNFLRMQSYCIWMISGDNQSNVGNIATKLNILSSKTFANCRPDQKLSIAANIPKYIMVGDGLNDSLILKQAAVSISHYDGADLSKHHADIVIKGNNLNKLKDIFKASQKFNKIVKQNFMLAIAYNSAALPLAFCGKVTPLIAAIFMSLSSICVVLNTLRLK